MRQHCCESMRTNVRPVTEPPVLVASDRPVVYDLVFDEYCLANPGETIVVELIAFCPWCGAELPASKRDRWFAELRRRGCTPDDPDLDARFQSDRWWQGERP